MFFLYNKFRLRNNKFSRLVFAGSLNTIFSVSIFAIIVNLGFSISVSLFVSLVAGIIFSFITTGRYVFQQLSLALFPRFIILHFFIYIVNLSVLKLILSFIDNKVIAQSMIAIPLGFLAYYLMKKFVFLSK